MTTDQLRLIPNGDTRPRRRRPDSWRLDDETIEAGRRGVAEAREVLLRRRTADRDHRHAA